MIHVKRDENPTVAVKKALNRKVWGTGKTELENARLYYAQVPTPTKAYEFSRYSSEKVCEALDQTYKEKCAYCESRYAAVKARNVEHYRPKGGVSESHNHPGYWWLAGEWSNLLPSCPACNQLRRHTIFQPSMTLEEIVKARYVEGDETAGKGNSFPMNVGTTWVSVEGASLDGEDPLLINPSARDPDNHLEWVFRWEGGSAIWGAEWVIPFLRPKQIDGRDDPHGKASIAIYALNRLKLVLERMDRVKTLQVALIPVIDVIEDIADAEEKRKPALYERLNRYWKGIGSLSAPDQPYCGMSRAFLNAVQEELKRLRSEARA
ncbi:hypothetical protein PQR46_20555 [Paraburkholderia sediminicola]|uniref:hypothetical protein n=1 Tax=Paraburkholderia sediminicola TaxID=458836 RepID=UPI0038B7C75B